jgi:hypothetical protein
VGPGQRRGTKAIVMTPGELVTSSTPTLARSTQVVARAMPATTLRSRAETLEGRGARLTARRLTVRTQA